MSFKRVNKEIPCPICGKPDWCLIASDRDAAICARVESDRLVGSAGAGWLHFLRDDFFSRPTWRPVKRQEKRRPVTDIGKLADECTQRIKPATVLRLSDELGVEPDALRALGVGWNASRRAFSFPMREPNGNICGIRYRARNGSKFSERGSREGLFFQPDETVCQYLAVVEGASDAAAMWSIGFRSVIGRASCHGNIEQVTSLCRRGRFNQVVIIPDSDAVGWLGAKKLSDALLGLSRIESELFQLPDGVKDVRQCIQQKKNADWLADHIGILVGRSSSKEQASNDNRI